MMNIIKYKKSLHFVAIIICIVCMGYLAEWLWKIIDPQRKELPVKKIIQPISQKKVTPPKAVNHDLRDILSANLFNQHKVVTKVELEQKQIPKTRQQLFLHGVISSSEPAHSIALISNKTNKPPLPYLQGDNLANNAGTVHLILNSYVQIKHNGRLEKLELMKAKNSKPLTRNSIKRTTVYNTISSLSDIKSHYKKNKSKLFSQFGLINTENGIKLSTKKGRLPPGLHAGDVITSVNGYSMPDLDSDLGLLDTILSSDKVEVSLERNGRNIHFNIPKKMIEQWK